MRVTTTRRRLNSRCKVLLELGPDNRVQFLHRSVKDYLDSRDIQHRLEEATGQHQKCKWLFNTQSEAVQDLSRAAIFNETSSCCLNLHPTLLVSYIHFWTGQLT